MTALLSLSSAFSASLCGLLLPSWSATTAIASRARLVRARRPRRERISLAWAAAAAAAAAALEDDAADDAPFTTSG